MALTVCQMAIKKDPKLNLKTASITFCRKVSGIDENKTSSNKKIGHVATPLVSLEALQALMEEDGEISNPSMFTEWAASLGIDLAAHSVNSWRRLRRQRQWPKRQRTHGTRSKTQG